MGKALGTGDQAPGKMEEAKAIKEQNLAVLKVAEKLMDLGDAREAAEAAAAEIAQAAKRGEAALAEAARAAVEVIEAVKCPHCHCPEVPAVNGTRRTTTVTLRYRQCSKCKHSFVTRQAKGVGREWVAG